MCIRDRRERERVGSVNTVSNKSSHVWRDTRWSCFKTALCCYRVTRDRGVIQHIHSLHAVNQHRFICTVHVPTLCFVKTIREATTT